MSDQDPDPDPSSLVMTRANKPKVCRTTYLLIILSLFAFCIAAPLFCISLSTSTSTQESGHESDVSCTGILANNGTLCISQNSTHLNQNNEVQQHFNSTDSHTHINVANPAFMPHESFLTVIGDPSTTEFTARQPKTTNIRFNKRDDYNEHLVCVGAQLKTAMDTQDQTYLQESSWNDPSLMFNPEFWRPSQSNGVTYTLNPQYWKQFLQQYFPGKDPELITYVFDGKPGTPVGKQAWKSYNDPSNGIQVIIMMFNGKEPITGRAFCCVWELIDKRGFPFQASDQLFLQWKQASTVKGNVGNIHWIGVQELVNEDTAKTLEIACPDGDPWPGCVFNWETNPRAASAILGSPNARFVGWMLLQHPNEFPRKTVLSIRAWIGGFGIGQFGGMWNLLFEIGDLPPLEEVPPEANPATTKSDTLKVKAVQTTEESPFKPTHLNGQRDVLEEKQKDTLTPVETTTDPQGKTPQQCICTGQGALQRIITQTDLVPSAFQDPALLDTAFWTSYEDNRSPPAGWTELIKARKICCGQWHYYYLLGNPQSLARAAYYAAYYHLASGTLLRASTFRGLIDNEQLGVPYKPSDIVFLGWKRWCLANKKQPGLLQRVLIDSVINKDTISAIQWVAFRLGKSVVPNWPGIILLLGSFEFMALLGTPNGISIAWMIINHPADLHMKRITSITVFTTNTGDPMMDFELGPLPQVLQRTGLEDLPIERDDAESAIS